VGNCLIYALKQYLNHGGYIIIRRSRVGWWPHFMWSPNLKDAEIEHFVPIQYRHDLKKPPFIFKGYIKKND
jgi:hypothetical protein